MFALSLSLANWLRLRNDYDLTVVLIHRLIFRIVSLKLMPPVLAVTFHASVRCWLLSVSSYCAASIHLVTDPEVVSNRLVNDPEVTSIHLVNDPDVASNHLDTYPEVSANHLVNDPEVASNHLVADPELSALPDQQLVGFSFLLH